MNHVPGDPDANPPCQDILTNWDCQDYLTESNTEVATAFGGAGPTNRLIKGLDSPLADRSVHEPSSLKLRSIRRACEAFARGDVATMLKSVDRDLEWTFLDPSLEDPEAQVPSRSPRACG